TFLKRNSPEFHEFLKPDGCAAHSTAVRSRTTRNALMRRSRNWVLLHLAAKTYEIPNQRRLERSTHSDQSPTLATARDSSQPTVADSLARIRATSQRDPL